MQCVTIIQVIGTEGLQEYGEGISRSVGVNEGTNLCKVGSRNQKVKTFN